MNVAIIRCDSFSDLCPAGSCLRAVRERTGGFSTYDDPILVGVDTCGGCSRGKADRITIKAERLKRLGAEVIHLGNCLIEACPYRQAFTAAIEDLGLQVVAGTH